MLTKEKALQAVKKHGSCAGAARALSVPRATFQHWLKGGAVKPKANAGKSLTEFRSLYDRSSIVPGRIKDALKALGEGWEYEAQFSKLAQISLSELASYRDKFSDHIVVLRRDGKRAWAGTRGAAQKMREMLGVV